MSTTRTSGDEPKSVPSEQQTSPPPAASAGDSRENNSADANQSKTNPPSEQNKSVHDDGAMALLSLASNTKDGGSTTASEASDDEIAAVKDAPVASVTVKIESSSSNNSDNNNSNNNSSNDNNNNNSNNNDNNNNNNSSSVPPPAPAAETKPSTLAASPAPAPAPIPAPPLPPTLAGTCIVEQKNTTPNASETAAIPQTAPVPAPTTNATTVPSNVSPSGPAPSPVAIKADADAINAAVKAAAAAAAAAASATTVAPLIPPTLPVATPPAPATSVTANTTVPTTAPAPAVTALPPATTQTTTSLPAPAPAPNQNVVTAAPAVAAPPPPTTSTTNTSTNTNTNTTTTQMTTDSAPASHVASNAVLSATPPAQTEVRDLEGKPPPPDFWYWLPIGENLREWDVLCGRGGESNNFVGNRRYRCLVNDRKEAYRRIPVQQRKAKTQFVKSIVQQVHAGGGRFVELYEPKGWYYVVTLERARRKTSQALRETKVLKWVQKDGGPPKPGTPIPPPRDRSKAYKNSVCRHCGKKGHKTRLAKTCQLHWQYCEVKGRPFPVDDQEALALGFPVQQNAPAPNPDLKPLAIGVDGGVPVLVDNRSNGVASVVPAPAGDGQSAPVASHVQPQNPVAMAAEAVQNATPDGATVQASPASSLSAQQPVPTVQASPVSSVLAQQPVTNSTPSQNDQPGGNAVTAAAGEKRKREDGEQRNDQPERPAAVQKSETIEL